LPGEAEQLRFFLAADALLASTGDRPHVQALFPQVALADGTPTHIPLHFQADMRSSNVNDRLAWMDEVGIDFALVSHKGRHAGADNKETN
jgi:hypothetical protein